MTTSKACGLVLRISMMCLSWRSIKSLKRPSHEMELEVLQLWSLIAFHKIYTQMGLEYFFSFIPFYYYFKMGLIIVTFCIPATRFPNFWFETILVPMMKGAHRWTTEVIVTIGDTDVDAWVNWLIVEIKALPWRVFDLVFPCISYTSHSSLRGSGTFEDNLEEETESTKNDELQRMPENNYDCKHSRHSDNGVNSINTDRTRKENKLTNIEETRRKKHRHSSGSFTSKISFDGTSPVARSKLGVSGLHLKKFARDHHYHNNSIKKTKIKNNNNNQTPTQQEQHNNSSNRCIAPPSSAFTTSKISSPLSSPFVSPPSANYPSSLSSSTPTTTSTKKPGRKSIGDRIRSVAIGSCDIRLRDYLFDLDLPKLPSPETSSFEKKIGNAMKNSSGTGGEKINSIKTFRQRAGRDIRKMRRRSIELSKEVLRYTSVIIPDDSFDSDNRHINNDGDDANTTTSSTTKYPISGINQVKLDKIHLANTSRSMIEDPREETRLASTKSPPKKKKDVTRQQLQRKKQYGQQQEQPSEQKKSIDKGIITKRKNNIPSSSSSSLTVVKDSRHHDSVTTRRRRSKRLEARQQKVI